ncbi:MAG: DUF3658 domain-containing protein [Chitinophagaceae bacterium]
MEKVIHIVSSESGASRLKAAFKLDPTLADEVMVLDDDLSTGPLFPHYEENGWLQRRDWIRDNLFRGKEDEENFSLDGNPRKSLHNQLEIDPDLQLWIWVAPNPMDLCNYYSLLYEGRAYIGRIQIIFLHNLPFLNERGGIFYPTQLGEIPPREFPKAKRLAREIGSTEWEMDMEEWERLVLENTGLRIMADGKKLMSQKVDFYDPRILSGCLPSFQKINKVIQSLQTKEKLVVSSHFLNWRIREMITLNQLEYRGDAKGGKELEIKLKSSEDGFLPEAQD